MNTTKRNLGLAAAIMGIVFGSIYTLFSIIALAAINDIFGNVSGVGLLTAILVMIMLISIAMIVIGAMLCPNPVQNGILKNKNGIMIAFLVITGILALLFLISMANAFTTFTLFMFLFVLAILGLAIASMCMKHYVPYGAPVQQPYQQQSYQQQPYQQPNPYQQQQSYQQNPYQQPPQQQAPYQQPSQSAFEPQQQQQQSPFEPQAQKPPQDTKK